MATLIGRKSHSIMLSKQKCAICVSFRLAINLFELL